MNLEDCDSPDRLLQLMFCFDSFVVSDCAVAMDNDPGKIFRIGKMLFRTCGPFIMWYRVRRNSLSTLKIRRWLCDVYMISYSAKKVIVYIVIVIISLALVSLIFSKITQTKLYKIW